MRQVHRAGEKGFVDFSGGSLPIVDPQTGETAAATLFLAVLGASNLTYAEPVLHQDLPTWIGAHVNALAYWGGVPAALVPDNPKVGVSRPDYYDPDLNPTYAEFAQYYGTVILPARPYHARDKAKVEQGVLLAERWILAALRNRIFYSLAELQTAVALLLERLNTRPSRHLGQSRRELFETMERATLRPLPPRPYEFALWTRPKVNIDYHVEFRGALLQRPVAAPGGAARPPRHGDHGGALSARAARGEPRAQLREASPDHRGRAHAGRASRAPRVVPLASDRLGRDRRAGDGRPHGGDHAAAPAPRAGLPRLPRPHASPEAPPGRPARAGLRPRAALPGLLLQERGRHPEPPPRRGRPPDH